jgi:hypothetical protein
VAAAPLRPWHHGDVPVVVILLAALIVGGVVVVAAGRGGELARERGRDEPARTDFRTWSDVAGYRPPPALLGYHAATTERALSLIARTIAERDAEIAWLRSRLAETRSAATGEQPVAESADEPVVRGGFVPQQAPAGEDA